MTSSTILKKINFYYYLSIKYILLFFTLRKGMKIYNVHYYSKINFGGKFNIVAWDVKNCLYIILNGTKILSKQNFIIVQNANESEIEISFVGWHKTEFRVLTVSKIKTNIKIQKIEVAKRTRPIISNTFLFNIKNKQVNIKNLTPSIKNTSINIKTLNQKIHIKPFKLNQYYE
jgi:hypothetical protein